jgi:hypothetical protein
MCTLDDLAESAILEGVSDAREIGLDETVVASEQPPSVGAMAIDADAQDKGSTLVDNKPPDECSLPDVELPVRRVPLWCNIVVAVTVAGCAAITTLAIVRGKHHDEKTAAHRTITPANVVATSTPAPAVEPPAPAPAPTPVSVKSLPNAAPSADSPKSTARISLAPSVPKKDATLTVDGKKATGTSAVVTCGHHTVVVGHTKPQSIDAPCGSNVLVDAHKPAAKTRTSKH